MTILEWKDDYSVGVREIDEQHATLLQMINDLYKENPQDDADGCFGHLNKLIKYAELHFTTEEQLMEQYGYEELQAHREEHDLFTMKVFDLNRQLEQADGEVYTELVSFVKEWYISHVLGVDKNYQQFFYEKGLK